MATITLTTDFGASEYVAQMKGVLMGIYPEARIVDISHDIATHSIIEGAYVMMTTVPHFKYAVHVGVVDPGVGGKRAPIVFHCERGILVGPDNGLLVPAAERLGLDACFEITNPDATWISKDHDVSDTFHGRDIFAPVAARLALGMKPREVGPQKKRFVKLDIMKCKVTPTEATGLVVRVDRFGNVITNIPRSALKARGAVEVSVGKTSYKAKAVRTYSDGKKGELLALASSSGLVELSVRDGRAAEMINAVPGDKFRLGL
jgi:hypothetical protein